MTETSSLAPPTAVGRTLCPLCHTDLPHAVARAGDPSWRCDRCGQQWDAQRLATVAAYVNWTLARSEQRPLS